MMPRRSASVAILLATCSCTSNATSWGRRQIIRSAYIKKNTSSQNCLKNEKECSSPTPLESVTTFNNYDSRAIFDIRGGSSYGDDYNDGYGNYRDDGDGENYNGRGSSKNNDDYGRGSTNDYNSRNDSFNDGDKGYSPSSASSGRDRYADDDYGRGSGVGGNGYYDDEGRYHEDYDDRGRGPPRRSSKTKTMLPAALTGSNRKLGIIFLSSGAAFTALGITLFFNKALMRLGNLLFVIGIPLMIGPGRTVGYFLQPQKARATGCLAVGILLVFVGHPVIGILLEIFGLLNLFGNMFPLVMMMAKNMPVLGGLFKGNSGGGGGSGGKRRDDRDDRYYEDDGYERESYRHEERY